MFEAVGGFLYELRDVHLVEAAHGGGEARLPHVEGCDSQVALGRGQEPRFGGWRQIVRLEHVGSQKSLSPLSPSSTLPGSPLRSRRSCPSTARQASPAEHRTPAIHPADRAAV